MLNLKVRTLYQTLTKLRVCTLMLLMLINLVMVILIYVSPSQDISKIITSALSDEKEREKWWLHLWQLHLIVHNLERSQESDPRKRKQSVIQKPKEQFQIFRCSGYNCNAFTIGKSVEMLTNYVYWKLLSTPHMRKHKFNWIHYVYQYVMHILV